MKYQILALAAAGLAAAVPHRHAHGRMHVEKRVPTAVETDVVDVAGPTVVLYSLNGQLISEAEVQAGIKNGSLLWANGAPQVASSSSSASATSSATFEKEAFAVHSSAAPSTTSSAYVAPTTTSSSSSSSAVETSTSSAYSAPTHTAAATSSAASSASTGSSSTSTGINTAFPDGEISCSDFPSAYGAVYIDYMDIGGWIGVQNPGSKTSAGYDDIETMTSSTCSGSDCCGDGMFCSYACPAGYQKSQWPALQGATSQSIGGLYCSGGKLYLTNSALSSNLCIPGVAEVDVKVENSLGEDVAICRTDYPGTESETVPLTVASGATEDVTCPDEATYYKWDGKLTSAQWYVNPAGLSASEACNWGTSSMNAGNWAPLNLGTGYSDGMAYLSMFPNEPTTDGVLDYYVTLTGDGLSSPCEYYNGTYTTNSGSTTSGCTVSISSGTATFQLTSSSVWSPSS